MNKVGIILLNYCGYEDTVECVKSLKDINYPSDEYSIIIVDNVSPDGSYEKIMDNEDIKDSGAVVLKSEKNGGFAYGNNVGIRKALELGCTHVLLLNNDTLVHKDCLKELMDCYERHEDNRAGIIGAKIVYESKRDTIWYAGGEINLKRFYGSHIGENEKDSSKFDKEKQITFVTGCTMLIGKKVLEDAGFLTEDYFMYYEDVDYCMKAMEKGYTIYYCPKAVVYHKVSASTGGTESNFSIQWNTRNRLVFMNRFKNAVPYGDYLKAKGFFYGTRVLRGISYIAKGRFNSFGAMIKGINEGKKVNK